MQIMNINEKIREESDKLMNNYNVWELLVLKPTWISFLLQFGSFDDLVIL